MNIFFIDCAANNRISKCIHPVTLDVQGSSSEKSESLTFINISSSTENVTNFGTLFLDSIIFFFFWRRLFVVLFYKQYLLVGTL